MSQPHPSNIDYLAHSKDLIGRPGRVFNPVTGCRHHETDICNIPCWARRLVEHGRLKGHKSYPYGFEPTFHPDRIKAVGPKSKWLLALNFMGDAGGDWKSKDKDPRSPFTNYSPEFIAENMVDFANLNPQHILLLLTKNPSWYGLIDTWPENVYCGFTATNNDELVRRNDAIRQTSISINRIWFSLEPWLCELAPYDVIGLEYGWTVIGGLSGKNPRPVSEATGEWIKDHYRGKHDFRLFVKDNFGRGSWMQSSMISHPPRNRLYPREYPDEWRVQDADK